MYQKGNVSFIILLLAILIAGGWYVYDKDPFSLFGTASPDIKACSREAMICPDGSAVTRTGPNCEFAACPNEAIRLTGSTSSGNSETANWKTYRNEKYGFEVKYPSDWDINEIRQVGVPYGFNIHPHIDDSDGRYSLLSILPGSCVEALNTIPKKVTVNEIEMERYDYGQTTAPIFHFAGNLNRGWDSACNTIQIDSKTNPDLYDTFVQILSTFKFTK